MAFFHSPFVEYDVAKRTCQTLPVNFLEAELGTASQDPGQVLHPLRVPVPQDNSPSKTLCDRHGMKRPGYPCERPGHLCFQVNLR